MTREAQRDRARTASSKELFSLIHDADESILNEILDNPHLEPPHLIAILRSPHISSHVVQHIVQHTEWVRLYRVKAALVLCPATPYTIASQMIHDLFWRDLAQASLNYSIDPRLRRIAEQIILQQLEHLAVGERKALIRVASRNLLVHLRNIEQHPKVLVALLQNPRLVEEDLLAVLSRTQIPIEFIRTLAGLPQWVMREQVRLAVLRHPHTPTHVAVQLTRNLDRAQLRRLLNDPKIRPTIKQTLQHLFKL